MLGTLVLFLLLVVLAAGYAWNQRRMAIQNALEAQEAQARAATAGEALAKSFGAKEEAEKWSKLAAEAQAQVRNLQEKGIYESNKAMQLERANRKLDESLSQARAENVRLRTALDEAWQPGPVQRGINKAIVPDFVGMTLALTTQKLANINNLKTGRITERPSDGPAGPDATHPIITIPKAAYNDDSHQPRGIKGQARIPTREGETVQLTVRGVSSAGAVAEGQLNIYVKPLAKWSVAEIVRVPIVSWGNSSRGSFVGIFEVLAQR